MQLIAILLITVAILTFLSGIVVFAGSIKGKRARSFWFLLSTTFATVWIISTALFLVAGPEKEACISNLVNIMYGSAIFIVVCLLGYISWKQKFGKLVTLCFLALGIALEVAFLIDPSQIYTGISLTNADNSIVISHSTFYLIYAAFFCSLVPAVVLSLGMRIFHPTTENQKKSSIVMLIGFLFSGAVSLVFNLILPIISPWTTEFIWAGPLAASTTIITFYYAILRYRVLDLSSRWLKAFSYIVVAASTAVVYIIIFAIIFAALFRGATPSMEVIILNFVMVLILISLFPAISELSTYMRSLISTQQIDMVYILKKIGKPSQRGVNIREIVRFLAEHAHFGYVGIIVGDQIYNSSAHKVSADCANYLDTLKPEPGKIWLSPDENSEDWQKLNLYAVAQLKDGGGKVYGYMLLGDPANKGIIPRREIIKLETVINLVAMSIDSKISKKAK